MITGLYSIYDMDTKEYSPIFHSANDYSAIRQFCLTMKDAPKVYQDRTSLYFVGSYDSGTGCITSFSAGCVFKGEDVAGWFADREKVVKPEVKNG